MTEVKMPEPERHDHGIHGRGFTAAQLKQYGDDRAREALRIAAKAVAPRTPRPCACDTCDCGNQDDAQRVSEWDAENAAAQTILALSKGIK